MKKYLFYFLSLSFVVLGLVFVFTSGEVQKPTGDGPDMRPAEWAYNQRTFPHNTAAPLAHYEAAKQAIQMRKDKAARIGKKYNNPEWEFAGPVNIGGRVVDIEYNILDPNTVYASAAVGGVFKSYDGGDTWFPIFDDQPIMPMGDLAINPVDTNIVYAGSGEPNGSHNNFPGAGVFKSTDAGQTWTNIGLELTAHTGRIVIDPTNPDRVFVAAVGSNFGTGPNRGVYATTNAGDTWEQVLFVSDSTGAVDLILDPTDPDFIMATMWERVRRPGFGQSVSSRGPTSGIYKSTDGGDTWDKLGPSNGLPGETENVGRIGLAIDVNHPDTVVAVYTDGGTYSGLYKSTDRGENWSSIDPSFQISGGVSSFSWYFGQVRINPHDPDFIYVLDVYFNYTQNGGTSWSNIYYDNLHVDHHALAFHPTDSNVILVGNDGGINKSTNKGASWGQHVNLPVTQFYEINIDYNNPDALYGGTQDNNTIRTTDGGLDNWERLLGGDGFYVNVDYNDNNYVYAEYQYGNLFRSTSGGYNMDRIMNGISESEPKNWSTPVVMDPFDSKVLYYGTNKLYKTTNRGSNWFTISDNLTLSDPAYPNLGTLTTIGVSPLDNNIIYTGSDDGQVHVSTDGGSNWSNITEGLPFRWITRVVPDNFDANTVYVTLSGLKWRDPVSHVFVSYNQGADWTDISNNLPDSPVNAFVQDFNWGAHLFVGNDVGVFYSLDFGATWEPLGQNLPVVPVYDLKIHPTENFLVAGTHGRSMYTLDLNQIVSVKDQNELIADKYKLSQNYPNPFNPTTSITYYLPEASNVNISVYNMNGELVSELVNSSKPEGYHDISWDATNSSGLKVASGAYIYKLRAGNVLKTRKMMFLK
ncbi:MAG: hypothetical protein SCALA702_20270 [Melioribacteraceae bacterium]|nr:MAG: hypothetical protein SCALA702_20270 [Melioribacteraceae bacterium]